MNYGNVNLVDATGQPDLHAAMDMSLRAIEHIEEERAILLQLITETFMHGEELLSPQVIAMMRARMHLRKLIVFLHAINATVMSII